jgi:thioredoxin reductase (NADPH)
MQIVELPTVPNSRLYDVAIVGGGPAGIAAAVTAASEGLLTVVVESGMIGGQAGKSSLIRNYLGFPKGISGVELSRRMLEQAESFGVHFVAGEVTGIEGDEIKIIHLKGNYNLHAKSVVLACGVKWRTLEAPGVQELLGAGVHYGADMRNAPLLLNKRILIVGGGNSAGQAAVYFAKYAELVVILARNELNMSAYLEHKVRNVSNIRVYEHKNVLSVSKRGNPLIRVKVNVGAFLVDEMFVMIGAEPNVGWTECKVDEHGFLTTGPALDTSIKGVYAIGDVRAGSTKRMSAAVGEGAQVIMHVQEYLHERRS